VHRNFFRLFLFSTILVSVFFGSCTKIDTTTLGADIIPTVDNVSTFDTVININGTQGFFGIGDSLTRSENHLLGSINNDPVFGRTTATLFLELKPSFFPYYFGARGDTINSTTAPGTGFDSAYLCLSVNGFYGDSLKAQHLKVYLLDQATSNFKDSSYRLNFTPNLPFNTALPIGDIVVQPTPTALSSYQYFNVKFDKKDSVQNQIRIKLSQSFLNDLTGNTDTANGSDLYRSDNNFKARFKGFAIQADSTATGGNGLLYIGINDVKTRLEVYYHSKKKDTSFSAFTLNTSASLFISNSAHASNVHRDYTGAEISAPPSDALYILSTPGTYAALKIPGLQNLSNRIIHRAELIVEQIPGMDPALDKALLPPPFLYLDLKDTVPSGRYITLFKDLSPQVIYDPYSSSNYFPSGGISLGYFGGFRRQNYDVADNRFYYNFNVSRYVQEIVTNHIPNYEMRLYAPYNLNYYGFSFAYPNSGLSIGNGRIKIGNGNNANPNYRLRLRIVYSKI
jgi:hypothetical protein